MCINDMVVLYITPWYTVRLDISSDIILEGAGLGQRFKVVQLHFHWGKTNSRGSEHKRNGKQYSMEVIYITYLILMIIVYDS